jgi:hypothetical protein
LLRGKKYKNSREKILTHIQTYMPVYMLDEGGGDKGVNEQ